MKWVKKDNGQWYKLFELELCEGSFQDLAGIYLVFYPAKNSPLHNPQYSVLKLGQGHVKTKILQLRNDPEMIKHQGNEPFVTWIVVPPELMDKIEQVLVKNLGPIMEM